MVGENEVEEIDHELCLVSGDEMEEEALYGVYDTGFSGVLFGGKAKIDKIEKTRTVNNINWMNILKLAFKHAPKEAGKLMKKINSDDKKISSLLSKLAK